MQRGAKPAPSALKVLRGRPGKDRINHDEPQPVPLAELQPPDWLGREAKAEWRRVAPMLASLGVVSAHDTAALAAYCEAWATWKEATRKVREDGLVVPIPGGHAHKVNPYLKIADKALVQLRVLFVEFGMTPSSRTRIRVLKPAAERESKWAGLK